MASPIVPTLIWLKLDKTVEYRWRKYLPRESSPLRHRLSNGINLFVIMKVTSSSLISKITHPYQKYTFRSTRSVSRMSRVLAESCIFPTSEWSLRTSLDPQSCSNVESSDNPYKTSLDIFRPCNCVRTTRIIANVIPLQDLIQSLPEALQ